MTRTIGHNLGRRSDRLLDIRDMSMYGSLNAVDYGAKKYRHKTTKWRNFLNFHLRNEIQDYADDHDMTIKDQRIRI